MSGYEHRVAAAHVYVRRGPLSARLLLCTVVAAFAADCGQRGGGPPQPPAGAAQSPPVRVATATAEDLPVELREVGRVETYNTVTVRSRVEGQITAIHFTDGQQVSTGDLLVTIDPRPFQAAVDQAQANLARDQAQAVEARKKAQQFEEAYQRKAAAEVDRDQARANSQAADATVQADQAALEAARLQLEFSSIRSPLDAKAGDRMVDLGNIVTANVTPLVLLNQIKPIYVTFSAPERHLPAIQYYAAAGTLIVKASLPGQSGPPAVGDLTFIDNQVNAATGTIRLKGTFANQDAALWPGAFANVTLVLAVEKSVLVPAEAIQPTEAGDSVFVLRPDQAVQPRQVTVGQTLGQRIVVQTGLEAGEIVVTEGQQRLLPGIKVQVLEPASQPAASQPATTAPAATGPAASGP